MGSLPEHHRDSVLLFLHDADSLPLFKVREFHAHVAYRSCSQLPARLAMVVQRPRQMRGDELTSFVRCQNIIAIFAPRTPICQTTCPMIRFWAATDESCGFDAYFRAMRRIDGVPAPRKGSGKPFATSALDAIGMESSHVPASLPFVLPMPGIAACFPLRP